MSDFPIQHSPSASSAGKLVVAVAGLIALFRTASGAVAQSAARHAQGRAKRRAPEEIFAAQARREEARRAVDRLWLQR